MPLSKSIKKAGVERDTSPEPGPSKRDKYSSDEDDDPVPRKGKGYQSSKMSKQGKMSKKSPNVISKQSGLQASHNKPAELFRKDLISAMKMADTEILHDDQYVLISDPWRQEWEKGVQVPVNEEELAPVAIKETKKRAKNGDFKLPPRKYLHEKNDETYQGGQHELTGMQELAEQIVRYDLDDQDVCWLGLVNEDREEMGLQLINEWNLERMIEELENQCYIKTNALKKTEEGLGIEYDEDVACDVCRMLESEDTNEMVFCDGCDICVHQACYGIQTIPEGSWLCRICALGIKPMCLLCPKRGGAMKSTKSGTKWTHVSCALWIPEVSIGCPEKMEPITKISNIPPSRWALVCCLCKERVGACIQCSVKQCKTAFHVTCGFAHNLDMKTVVDDSDDSDGIHLRAYCPKHTKNRNASDSESPKKGEEDGADNENDISEAEMAKKRMEKLKQLEEEFYTLVDTQDIAVKFYIPEEAVDVVAEYWKLKRKVNNNKPLITPKMEEEDQMQKQQKDSLSARMKMFVHLRQDLERARNLCYMISKREKTKRQFFKVKESLFHAQIQVLTDPNLSLSAREAEKIRQDYYFDSIYSDYGVMSARSNKQPRENLFTLENLKTPKDFVDSGEDSEVSCTGGKLSLKSHMLSSSNRKKDRIKSDNAPVDSVAVSGKSEHRENLFSVESFKVLSGDSTADSGDEESVSKNTHSSQMSRLGKVKLKEIQEKEGNGEPGDIKTIPDSPFKKFVPTSDLRKKLTSILNSKNMMQQRQEKALPEAVTDMLHVDVENSDSEVFTSTSDTSVGLMSPTDQPRNLFDQFRMKDKHILSSPDLPDKCSIKSRDYSRRQRKKYKKQKHRRSPHKRKKSRMMISPSDQSTISPLSIKREVTASADGDSYSIGQASHLLSDDTDHDRSMLSPTFALEASDQQDRYRHSSSSPSKSGSGRKKRSCKDRDKTLSPGKSLRSSSSKLQSQISPSPHVDPDNVYPTMDGDIYVPSGKIQVTERTIVLDTPKEEHKTRLKSKLRLKKQSSSPVKGMVSYEVVKDEDDRQDIFKEEEVKVEASEKKNIFDSVLESTGSQAVDLSDKEESEISSLGQRSLRKHKKIEDPGPRTRQSGKVSDTESSVSLDVKDIKKETIDETEGRREGGKKSPSKVGRQRKRRRAAQATGNVSENDEEIGYSSDENFRPKGRSPKVSPIDRSKRTCRLQASRRLHQDETEGDDDSDVFMESSPTRRKCAHNHNTSKSPGGRGIKLTPLPNKPELNALLDSSKLVVKEPLKRQVSEKLGKILKRKGRWGGLNGVKEGNQTTLDKFVKRTSSSENIFSKPDIIKDPNAKRLSLPLARSDLSPLRVNKSSTINSLNESSDSPPKASVLPMSPIKAAAMANNIFGAHSSPRGSLSSYRIPRKTDSTADWSNKTPSQSEEAEGKSSEDKKSLFGDVEKGLKRQLSFEDVSRKSELAEVVKTPSKCDPSELTEDRLDGNPSYRSHSPPSSEGSGASNRILQLDPNENTPSKRVTRSQLEDSQSPTTRLRKREGLLKAPQLKLS